MREDDDIVGCLQIYHHFIKEVVMVEIMYRFYRFEKALASRIMWRPVYIGVIMAVAIWFTYQVTTTKEFWLGYSLFHWLVLGGGLLTGIVFILSFHAATFVHSFDEGCEHERKIADSEKEELVSAHSQKIAELQRKYEQALSFQDKELQNRFAEVLGKELQGKQVQVEYNLLTEIIRSLTPLILQGLQVYPRVYSNSTDAIIYLLRLGSKEMNLAVNFQRNIESSPEVSVLHSRNVDLELQPSEDVSQIAVFKDVSFVGTPLAQSAPNNDNSRLHRILKLMVGVISDNNSPAQLLEYAQGVKLQIDERFIGEPPDMEIVPPQNVLALMSRHTHSSDSGPNTFHARVIPSSELEKLQNGDYDPDKDKNHGENNEDNVGSG